jgi:phage-related protein
LPDISAGCHELRIIDGSASWRIVYHIAADAIVILEVFARKTARMPRRILTDCRQRLSAFEKACKKKGATRARR